MSVCSATCFSPASGRVCESGVGEFIMLKKTLLAGMTMATLLAAGNAMAVGVPVSSFSLNFEDAADKLGATYSTTGLGNLHNLSGVNKMTYLGHSVVTFDSNPLLGGTVAFDDYFVIKITDFVDGSNASVLDFDVPGLNISGYGSNHDLTVVAHLRGTYTGATNKISFTTVKELSFYVDAGAGLTLAKFNDVTTFNDGLLVEKSVNSLSGDGALTFAGSTPVDAAIVLEVKLVDVLSTLPGIDTPFEFDFMPELDSTSVVFGRTDGNNDLGELDPTLGAVSGGIDLAGFGSVFSGYNGPTAAGDVTAIGGGTNLYVDHTTGKFFFTADNDGSITKSVIPEPASAALAFLGLAGVARATRRRK